MEGATWAAGELLGYSGEVLLLLPSLPCPALSGYLSPQGGLYICLIHLRCCLFPTSMTLLLVLHHLEVMMLAQHPLFEGRD